MDYFYKGKAIKKNAPISWIAKADSLAANTNLVCVENVDNKKNSVLSATAFFSTFTSLTVAHGYQLNYGNWCVVDGTNITTYYGTSATQMSQVAHGLTISDFLTVIIKKKTTQNAEITIMTKEGQFTTSTVPHWHGSNGDVRMFGAQTMTDAEISYGLTDSRNDVWLFVDSYGTDGDSARVPRQIQNLGYSAFLACGHGGGNSAQTFPQFEKLIELAQPKICVWMIGMNDPDSSTAINSTWKSYAEKFAAACEARGIIPVFTTIPNVPNYRHTFKNDWIKASGYRYVDWAQAVGAEEAGSTWYTGMLSTDNVHPAELGAKALAMRTVLDVPELMTNFGEAQSGSAASDPVLEEIITVTGDGTRPMISADQNGNPFALKKVVVKMTLGADASAAGNISVQCRPSASVVKNLASLYFTWSASAKAAWTGMGIVEQDAGYWKQHNWGFASGGYSQIYGSATYCYADAVSDYPTVGAVYFGSAIPTGMEIKVFGVRE